MAEGGERLGILVSADRAYALALAFLGAGRIGDDRPLPIGVLEMLFSAFRFQCERRGRDHADHEDEHQKQRYRTLHNIPHIYFLPHMRVFSE